MATGTSRHVLPHPLYDHRSRCSSMIDCVSQSRGEVLGRNTLQPNLHPPSNTLRSCRSVCIKQTGIVLDLWRGSSVSPCLGSRKGNPGTCQFQGTQRLHTFRCRYTEHWKARWSGPSMMSTTIYHLNEIVTGQLVRLLSHPCHPAAHILFRQVGEGRGERSSRRRSSRSG